MVDPHTTAGPVLIWNAERLAPPPPAARSGYAEFCCVITTPGVVVESTELTAVAPPRPALLMIDVSALHSFGSMMPLPVVTVFAPTASTGSVASASAPLLYATSAKSWLLPATVGSACPAMLVAGTMMVKLPLTPAGRNTLSTLLRGSATPPVVEFAPEKTLPR